MVTTDTFERVIRARVVIRPRRNLLSLALFDTKITSLFVIDDLLCVDIHNEIARCKGPPPYLNKQQFFVYPAKLRHRVQVGDLDFGYFLSRGDVNNLQCRFVGTSSYCLKRTLAHFASSLSRPDVITF